MARSRNIIDALDSIRDVLEFSKAGNISFPQLAIGGVEQVLAFNCDEIHRLTDANTPHPYFSAQGFITDLNNNRLPGSSLETTLPIDPAKLSEVFQWPPPQPAPFNKPPIDSTHVTGVGFTKQIHSFADGSSFVTIGPALPKIAVLKNGGAQFWVDGTGVVTQGTGKYARARGMAVYLGSAYFESWPATQEDQAKLLSAGYRVLVACYVELIYQHDLP